MSMSKSLVLTAAVVFAATAAAGAVTAFATEASTDVLMMKPMQGTSFRLGSKYAVAYYLRRPNTCDLTVLLSEAGATHDAVENGAVEDVTAADVKGAVTRLRFDVRSGASVRVSPR